MINRFILRAKWTRKARKHKIPQEKTATAPRADDVRVDVARYFLTHAHIAACWNEQRPLELAWFFQSLRGELPEAHAPVRNYTVHHVFLKPKQYLLALEALTTRLGVRL